MSYAIAIDTGGTFTDLVLADDRSVRGLHKAATTPADPFEGIRGALVLAAEAEGLALGELLADTETIVYGTTHATNAILEGRTARTAFLTTEGHRDILLYREGGKADPFDLAVPYPAPYVPRSLTFEVRERITSDARVAVPLDESILATVIERLRELEVEAVGVCLLWSILDPSHELRVGERLASELPGVAVTLSHQINPILREYRRASACVIDASLKPLMRRHLGELDRKLRDIGFAGEPLMVTHMSGGVLGMGEMCERPLHCVDSGPALAPVAGLTYAALEADGRDLLVVDAGGTSFDVSPTRDRRVVYSREKWLGERWSGHMTGLPAVETRSIGAGGGSIAQVDAGGLLSVGPRSAGSDPGPACYGRGGTLPTVTDAALALGYLDPDFFLGGRMRLTVDRARTALEQHVAKPLGLAVEEAAEAVMTVFSESVRSFLSEMTIAQGLDPRDCLIVAGGGSAGLFIVPVARELGIGRVVVPALAAGLSALGGQFADLYASFSCPLHTSTADFDFPGVARAIEELDGRVDDFFERVDHPGERVRERVCEGRYANQLWEIDVPLPDSGLASDADLESLARRFDTLHEALFAVNQPGEPIELCALRAEARVRRRRPSLTVGDATLRSGEPGSREIFLAGRRRRVPVYRGRELAPGERVDGPALIEEPATTLLIDAGAHATVAGTHYTIEVGGRA